MTAPERGVGRTLIHPGGVEVTDAQALATLCTLREALPFDDVSLTTMRREEGEAFVKGMFGILACLDTTIALHSGSIAVEDAAIDARAAEGGGA